MNSLQSHEVVFNLELFKKLRFYHLFDPHSAKIFNHNIYRLVCIALIVSITAINVYGFLGFIVKMEDTVGEIELIQILYNHMHSFLSALKISVCIYNADKIWDLLDVTRINFMKSSHSLKHLKILYKYQETSIKIINFIYVLLKITVIGWIIFPLLLNITSIADRGGEKRYENILNYRFPMKIHLYNSHFFLIYIFELEVVFIIAYSWLVIYILLISISYVFTAQYEMCAQAFEMIGHEEEFQNGKHIIENKRHY